MDMPLGPMPQGPMPIHAQFPGLDVLQKLFLKMGLDPSLLMSLGMVITVLVSLGGLTTNAWFAIKRFGKLISDNLVSQATIHSSDQTFLYLMKWLATNNISTDCRLFCVTSKKNKASSTVKRLSYYNSAIRGGNAGEESEEDEEDDLGPKLKYTPAPVPPVRGHVHKHHIGSSYFFYKRHLIVINRKLDITFYTGDVPDETIVLTTVGRSPNLLRSLLDEARAQYLISQNRKTNVFTISGSNYQKSWDHGRARPSRAMSTVIMEDKDKDLILRDSKEYLHPETAKWYAARGLPYRRGYLFYGPPGTGKTSLTLALAGELKLSLYIFSLSAGSGLNDETLALLFQSLPRRCIVLLEDIDCTGIGRGYNASNSDDECESSSSEGEEVETAGDTSKFTKSPQKKGSQSKTATSGVTQGQNTGMQRQPGGFGRHPSDRGGVSFSGLLNAIDGVASHEGRILIMTTNHRERLDPALIRPGRVDLQIEFGYAVKETSRRVFCEMYQGQPKLPSASASASNTTLIPDTKAPSMSTPINNPLTPPSTPLDDKNTNGVLFHPQTTIIQEKTPLHISTSFPATSLSIPSLAEQFADAIPPGQFTPAELQGYLIMHKHDPYQAIQGIASWVDEKLKEKGVGSDGLKIRKGRGKDKKGKTSTKSGQENKTDTRKTQSGERSVGREPLPKTLETEESTPADASVFEIATAANHKSEEEPAALEQSDTEDQVHIGDTDSSGEATDIDDESDNVMKCKTHAADTTRSSPDGTKTPPSNRNTKRVTPKHAHTGSCAKQHVAATTKITTMSSTAGINNDTSGSNNNNHKVAANVTGNGKVNGTGLKKRKARAAKGGVNGG